MHWGRNAREADVKWNQNMFRIRKQIHPKKTTTEPVQVAGTILIYDIVEIYALFLLHLVPFWVSLGELARSKAKGARFQSNLFT